MISSFVGMLEWRRHGGVLVSVDVIHSRAYRHRLFHPVVYVDSIRQVRRILESGTGGPEYVTNNVELYVQSTHPAPLSPSNPHILPVSAPGSSFFGDIRCAHSPPVFRDFVIRVNGNPTGKTESRSGSWWKREPPRLGPCWLTHRAGDFDGWVIFEERRVDPTSSSDVAFWIVSQSQIVIRRSRDRRQRTSKLLSPALQLLRG